MTAARRARLGVAITLSAAALVGAAAPERAAADVLLVKGRSVLESALPPFVPMPDGTVVAANDIALRCAGVPFSAGDVLVYDVAGRTAARYGDTSTVSLAAFGTQFGGAVMILDPRTLTFSAFANQVMPLDALLDRPGVMVIVDVGPATVPASVLSIRASDIHSPTPSGGPTRTPTVTRTAGAGHTPTVSTTPGVQPTPTRTGPIAATPTPTGALPTATPSATVARPCSGDCNGDEAVTVDELVRAVNIALDLVAIDHCPVVDLDGNGAVAVNELVAAVDDALRGCN
ncbi:MAG: hypothetical protein AB7V27_03565 [Candidatus Binatia bacterium]